jgi:hypothetical protein
MEKRARRKFTAEYKAEVVRLVQIPLFVHEPFTSLRSVGGLEYEILLLGAEQLHQVQARDDADDAAAAGDEQP